MEGWFLNTNVSTVTCNKQEGDCNYNIVNRLSAARCSENSSKQRLLVLEAL